MEKIAQVPSRIKSVMVTEDRTHFSGCHQVHFMREKLFSVLLGPEVPFFSDLKTFVLNRFRDQKQVLQDEE